jgi:hypothetical protein
MVGMVAQGRWRRRRPTSLVLRHSVNLGGQGTGVHPPFEGSAILFRGCGASAVREWVAQCHGVDTGLTAQCRTSAGMASPGGLAEQHWGMIPRRVRGTSCVDSSAGVRALNAPVREQVRGLRAREGLERGGPHPRGRPALERGGAHPRGRPALERGGTLPEGASSPQARRGFVSAALCPSSKAEFRLRAAGPRAPATGP